MLRPGLSLLLALCMASLCPGSLGRLSRPSWATLMWDVPDQDLQQQRTGLGSQRSYRPLPAGPLQHIPAGLGPALVSPEVACLSCSALCLLLSGALLVCYLCRKAKRHLREVSYGGQAGGMVSAGWAREVSVLLSPCSLPCPFQ